MLYNEQKYSSKQLLDAIIALVPHKKEAIMTAARQLEIKGEQRGEQRGMQQGMHTKSLEIAKHMLSHMHLDMKTVSQATGLSEAELMQLREAGKK